VVFAVARYDLLGGKKKFRPMHKCPNGWAVGDLPGKLPLYRTRDLAANAAAAVLLPEGESCADALARLGFTVTASSHGAKSAAKTDWTLLAGRIVNLFPDDDDPGRAYVEEVARILTGLNPPACVRIVDLPGLSGLGEGADIVNWLDERDAADDETLRREIQIAMDAARPAQPAVVTETPTEAAPQATPSGTPASPSAPPVERGHKPEVVLPGGPQPVSDTAQHLGQLLSRHLIVFNRGGAIVFLDGRVIRPAKPASLPSLFETVARLVVRVVVKGQPLSVPTICTESTARLIGNAAQFLSALPPLNLLSNCAVLIDRRGQLETICGYDRESGIMAFGQPPPAVPLDRALELFKCLFHDFQFPSCGDRARAYAAILQPAFVFGALLGERVPLDVGEANAPQTGKGMRNKLTAAIYNDQVMAIAQRQGRGVGSLNETFDRALLSGKNFISFDNFRGKLDLEALEMFLTEDQYIARALRQDAEIDPGRVVLMLTSNNAEMTQDLVARSAVVRLLHRSPEHLFQTFPEGDILAHVRANQALYLGAVFAVIHAWHAAGKPRTAETGHARRAWAQVMDWICQNLLRVGPLLAGHEEARAHMANPFLGWLRVLALEVVRQGRAGTWLRTWELLDILQASVETVEIPGLEDGANIEADVVRRQILQAIGRRLKGCFSDRNRFDLDHLRIERQQTPNSQEGRTDNAYCVSTQEQPALATPPVPHMTTEFPPEAPPEEIAQNRLFPPIPPDHAEVEDMALSVTGNIQTSGGDRRSGGWEKEL